MSRPGLLRILARTSPLADLARRSSLHAGHRKEDRVLVSFLELLGQAERLFELPEGSPRFFQREPELGLVEQENARAAPADDCILQLRF